jgi:hypothetical protein
MRAAKPERRALEALIDDTVDQSFPASDPPAWTCASKRAARLPIPPVEKRSKP